MSPAGDDQQPIRRTDDESLVDLRCAVVVLRDDAVLLIRRENRDDPAAAGHWVLPGGRPRDGESMVACARREVREETGLVVAPNRCAFVLEVTNPKRADRIVELVFVVDRVPRSANLSEGEPGRAPQWVPLAELGSTRLRPPIGGYLRRLADDLALAGRTALRARTGTAAYLGNLWRPDWPDTDPSPDDRE